MIKSRAFIIGFLSGLLLFVAINIYTYDDGTGGAAGRVGVRMVTCFDCLEQFGWPFRLYQSDTFAHLNEFLMAGADRRHLGSGVGEHGCRIVV